LKTEHKPLGSDYALALKLVREEYELYDKHYPGEYDHIEQAAMRKLEALAKEHERMRKRERPAFWTSVHDDVRTAIRKARNDFVRAEVDKHVVCFVCGDDGAITCEKCAGSGEGMGDGSACSVCRGAGEVPCFACCEEV